MSRTYRKGKIINGKYSIIKNINKESTTFFWRHDLPKDRRKLNRKRRREEKQHFKKFGEIPKYYPSRGWETW